MYRICQYIRTLTNNFYIYNGRVEYVDTKVTIFFECGSYARVLPELSLCDLFYSVYFTRCPATL